MRQERQFGADEKLKKSLEIVKKLSGDLRAVSAAQNVLPAGKNGAEQGFYLSVVVVSRNDDFGGGELHRMTQHFLDSLALEAASSEFWIELIFVEWNPVEDRRLLQHMYRWPAHFVSTKIISVPLEVALAADALDLPQFLAKNVGVRRAEGDFVLVTNADVLIASGFGQWMRRKPLKDNVLYTANTPHWSSARDGKPLNLHHAISLAELRRQCVIDPTAVRINKPTLDSLPNRVFPSDFMLASRDVWRNLRGFTESRSVRQSPAVALQVTANNLGIASSFIAHTVVCHQHHEFGSSSSSPSPSSPSSPAAADTPPARLNGANWGLAKEDEQLTIIRLHSHSTLL